MKDSRKRQSKKRSKEVGKFDPTTLEIYRALYTSVAEETRRRGDAATRRKRKSFWFYPRVSASPRLRVLFSSSQTERTMRTLAGLRRVLWGLRRMFTARGCAFRLCALCAAARLMLT